MESLFVKYDQSLNLKELGFDEPCLAFYDGTWDTKIYFNYKRDSSGDYEPFTTSERLNWFGAPLKQQVFRWFRDNHQLFYTIETNCSQLSSEWGFDYTIFDKENDKWLSTEPQNCPPGETTYKTYEETESGCIDKLIEMVKKK